MLLKPNWLFLFNFSLIIVFINDNAKSIYEFYENETFVYDSKLNKWKTKFNPENYKAKNFSEEVLDVKFPDGTRKYYNSNIMNRWFSKE